MMNCSSRLLVYKGFFHIGFRLPKLVYFENYYFLENYIQKEDLSMKIITWNVNGYRAAWKKGFYDWFSQADPDILCIQEIKAKTEQLDASQLALPGYSSTWNPAQRPGYSGVAMFIRNSLLPQTPIPEAGIPDERFDDEDRKSTRLNSSHT